MHLQVFPYRVSADASSSAIRGTLRSLKARGLDRDINHPPNSLRCKGWNRRRDHMGTPASRLDLLVAEASVSQRMSPPGGMKPPRVVTPQGPHPTPFRPPVLSAPLPVSYLEEGPLERVVLGRGLCPPIPRAKLSHPVCLSKVDSGMLWERVTYPLDVCRRTSRLIQGVYMHICQAPLKSGPHPSVSFFPARPTGPRAASADWSARWLVGPI